MLEGGSKQGQVALGRPGRHSQGQAKSGAERGRASCCGGGWAGLPLPHQNPGRHLVQPRGSKPECLLSPPHISDSDRDQRCNYFVRTFVPSSQPGQFSLGNIKGEF